MSNNNITLMEKAVEKFSDDVFSAINSLTQLNNVIYKVKEDPESDTEDYVRVEYIRKRVKGLQEALSKVYPKTLTPMKID